MRSKITKLKDKQAIVTYLWDNDYIINQHNLIAVDHIRIFYNTFFDTANNIVNNYLIARRCTDISKQRLLQLIFKF
jgi:hypothetical protein